MADTAFAAVFGEERVSNGERAVGHVPDIVPSRPVVHYMRQGDKRVIISIACRINAVAFWPAL